MMARTSRMTMIVLASAFAYAVTPAMATSRSACRRACRALIAHGCAGVFDSSRHCRARVLRQCRMDGTTQCDAAAVCTTSCSGVVSACESANGSAGQSTNPFALLAQGTCENFGFSRCVEHGVQYCSAPGTRNGCNRLAAEDHRGEPLVTVAFSSDGVAYDYAPECILVSSGTTVRFHGFFFGGSFADEPLVGGDAPTADPMSPFYPPTTSGTVRDFVLTQSGTFPYFGGDFGHFIESRPFGTGLPWGAVIVDNAP